MSNLADSTLIQENTSYELGDWDEAQKCVSPGIVSNVDRVFDFFFLSAFIRIAIHGGFLSIAWHKYVGSKSLFN